MNSNYKRITKQFSDLPKLFSYGDAAQRYQTTVDRLTAIVARKRGVRAKNGAFIKLTNYRLKIGSDILNVLDEFELDRAKRAGVL